MVTRIKDWVFKQWRDWLQRPCLILMRLWWRFNAAHYLIGLLGITFLEVGWEMGEVGAACLTWSKINSKLQFVQGQTDLEDREEWEGMWARSKLERLRVSRVCEMSSLLTSTVVWSREYIAREKMLRCQSISKTRAILNPVLFSLIHRDWKTIFI